MSRAGEHAYDARLTWTGNRGGGTATYEGYDRDYRISISGKADLVGSAHAQFRGDPAVHDPEDLLLGAITGCHMLAYLALCARNGVSVLAYEDEARGTLRLDRDGGGRFVEVRLRPSVVIAADADPELARSLHGTAHARCFIANSCSVPIHHEARVRRAAARDAGAAQ